MRRSKPFIIAILFIQLISSGKAKAMTSPHFLSFSTLYFLNIENNAEINGALEDRNKNILLYGSSSNLHNSVNTSIPSYSSVRDSMVFMLSQDGSLQWLTINGTNNVKDYCEYIGGSIFSQTIVLCQRILYEDSWDERFRIIILNNQGKVSKEIPLPNNFIVRKTTSTDRYLLLSGFQLDETHRTPCLYAVNENGDISWAYKEEPFKWSDEQKHIHSFKNIEANPQGSIALQLDHGNGKRFLLLLNENGELLQKYPIDNLNPIRIWITENALGAVGYKQNTSFICISFAFTSTSSKTLNIPLSSRLSLPKGFCGNTEVYHLCEDVNIPTAIWVYSPEQNKMESITLSSLPDGFVADGFLLLSSHQYLIWGHLLSLETLSNEALLLILSK